MCADKVRDGRFQTLEHVSSLAIGEWRRHGGILRPAFVMGGANVIGKSDRLPGLTNAGSVETDRPTTRIRMVQMKRIC